MDTSNLKGKTILIGREPGKGRLAVVVSMGDKVKTAAVGSVGSVPKSVSRYKAETGDAHCEVKVSADGIITVTSKARDNKMFINGAGVTTKRVGTQTVVELGADHYPVSMETVLAVAAKLVGKTPDTTPPEPAYSITHLERVWDNYHKGDIALQKRQSTIGLLSSVPLFFSMGSGVLAGLSRQFEWPQWVTGLTLVLTVIGIILFAYGFYLRYTFHYIDKREALKDKFMGDYICPKCHHFVGNSPYKLVKQSKKCPKCGCTWTDE